MSELRVCESRANDRCGMVFIRMCPRRHLCRRRSPPLSDANRSRGAAVPNAVPCMRPPVPSCALLRSLPPWPEALLVVKTLLNGHRVACFCTAAAAVVGSGRMGMGRGRDGDGMEMGRGHRLSHGRSAGRRRSQGGDKGGCAARAAGRNAIWMLRNDLKPLEHERCSFSSCSKRKLKVNVNDFNLYLY